MSSIFQKMIEDKKAVSKCVKQKGNLSKLAKERGIKFSTPL